uniref:Uncharacterized protein n=1 Tax=Steinernema glaseri TaxID=37863 RepID=A0A1I7Y7P5_9BILA
MLEGQRSCPQRPIKRSDSARRGKETDWETIAIPNAVVSDRSATCDRDEMDAPAVAMQRNHSLCIPLR